MFFDKTATEHSSSIKINIAAITAVVYNNIYCRIYFLNTNPIILYQAKTSKLPNDNFYCGFLQTYT